jgi:hypothetical protein
MSNIKTVLEPAVVSCPRPLPSSTAHECEFTLNIGVFTDGTDNNKTIDLVPSVSANSYTARNVSICRNASSVKFLGTLTYRLASSLAVLCTATLMTACAAGFNDLVPQKDMVGVSIASIGHLGSMVGIPDFYVNGHWGGNNSGWGGGGGSVCCILLPVKAVEPMMVNVTWQTCDISGIKFVNDRIVDPTQQCKEEEHEASVPIHFAVEPGDSSGLNVHFLPGNRIEVWMARGYPEGSLYPGPKYPSGPAPAYAPLPDEKLRPSASDHQSK